MGTVNFTAHLVDNSTIKKRGAWFNYKNQDVSIIEFDSNNKQDLQAIRNASQAWKNNGGKFIDEYCYLAENDIRKSEIINHFYALTTQKENFKDICPKNILGMMLFQEELSNPNNEIGLLEVNPNTNKSRNFLRKYKQVGRKLVEFVQTKFSKKNIEVFSDYRARKFYKKLGFTQNSPDVCDLCWKVVK